ncbi:MAG: NAD(P)H-binding protein [Deltaproteobacteria bacterium]|jgi:uncharacterized protein YbjT (DUF2867 family)|nr:NAD(P)H-binding protein [Deltaproteobacteria bacterium]
MKVILFGATGMVGQGVLRECLLDPDVTLVLAVVRTSTGQHHPKLVEVLHQDFFDYAAIADRLADFDACFFCLGVSSAGMSEARYRRVTYDLTLAAARALLERSPAVTFVYVSGLGTDSTARGRIMWARIKGETENALLAMPFRAAYMFRPAMIQPLHGVTPKAGMMRAFHAVIAPLLAVLKAVAPRYVTTTENVGRAMLAVAKRGAPKPVLESSDIDRIARDLSS